MRPTSTTIVPTSTCATLQPNGDTANANAHLDTAKGKARIQRTFSEIATTSNEGGQDHDVKTTSASKELSGRPHGPTLPGTSTVCRDKSSPTLSTKPSRSKRNWPYHPTGCGPTSGAEAYITYRRTKKSDSSCERTANDKHT